MNFVCKECGHKFSRSVLQLTPPIGLSPEDYKKYDGKMIVELACPECEGKVRNELYKTDIVIYHPSDFKS